MNKVREGYKMTELGEIPSEWHIKTINDLIKENIIIDVMDGNHGEIHPKASDYVDIGIPFIMANNLKNGKLDIENCRFISYEQAKSLRKGFAIEGDVLLTHKGTLGETAIVPKLKDEYIMLTPQVTYYRLSDNNVLINRYLKIYFDSKKYQDKLKNFGSQSTRDYVGITEQRKLSIVLPTIEEQEKIASILSTVDEQIDSVDALIEKNKELKKGLMQTLLTKGIGHTKFKKTEIGEIPEEWEVKKIIDIATTTSGGTPSRAKKEYYENGIYPWVKTGELYNKYISETEEYITEDALKKSSAKLVQEGAVIIAMYGATIGKLSIAKRSVTTNQACCSIICNDNICYNEYLYYRLDFEKENIINLGAGGAQPNISQDIIKNYKIAIPSRGEQQRIALILSEIDEKIDEYENKKQKLEEIKKGLMQQLLTGKIRVL